jgi:hypothetical protein
VVWNEDTGDKTVPEFVTKDTVELTEEAGIEAIEVEIIALVISVVVI